VTGLLITTAANERRLPCQGVGGGEADRRIERPGGAMRYDGPTGLDPTPSGVRLVGGSELARNQAGVARVPASVTYYMI
jgi:hypothetical protein